MGFFVFFRVRDTGATRGQYLAWSEASPFYFDINFDLN